MISLAAIALMLLVVVTVAAVGITGVALSRGHGPGLLTSLPRVSGFEEGAGELVGEHRGLRARIRPMLGSYLVALDTRPPRPGPVWDNVEALLGVEELRVGLEGLETRPPSAWSGRPLESTQGWLGVHVRCSASELEHQAGTALEVLHLLGERPQRAWAQAAETWGLRHGDAPSLSGEVEGHPVQVSGLPDRRVQLTMRHSSRLQSLSAVPGRGNLGNPVVDMMLAVSSSDDPWLTQQLTPPPVQEALLALVHGRRAELSNVRLRVVLDRVEELDEVLPQMLTLARALA